MPENKKILVHMGSYPNDVIEFAFEGMGLPHPLPPETAKILHQAFSACAAQVYGHLHGIEVVGAKLDFTNTHHKQSDKKNIN